MFKVGRFSLWISPLRLLKGCEFWGRLLNWSAESRSVMSVVPDLFKFVMDTSSTESKSHFLKLLDCITFKNGTLVYLQIVELLKTSLFKAFTRICLLRLSFKWLPKRICYFSKLSRLLTIQYAPSFSSYLLNWKRLHST